MKLMRIVFCVLVVAVILVFGCDSANAQTFWVENQNVLRNEKVTPQANIYGDMKFNDKLGMFGWSLLSEEWSEVILGPTFSPTSSMQFAVGVGVETYEKPARAYFSAWFGGAKSSLFLNWETGGSGTYYLTEGNLGLGKGVVGIGFRGERFVGIGPRVELKLGKVMLWALPVAWDPEDNNTRISSLALRLSF
jgi:hypothetical protein